MVEPFSFSIGRGLRNALALSIAAALAGLGGASGVAAEGCGHGPDPCRLAADQETEAAEDQRRKMITMIQAEAQATRIATGISAIGPEVLAAMARVPRHAFLPATLRPYAYLPTPLPVTDEQNIAAPFLVALMTHLAQIDPGDKVFETGTGAGYHAAVLAELSAQVFSVEVIDKLADHSARLLADLGYEYVQVRGGDGYYGWAEAGPFDAIIVKEAVNHIPDPLLRQLKPGGRMVLPLGPTDDTQHLTVVEKQPDGSVRSRRVLPVKFSPLQGGERL